MKWKRLKNNVSHFFSRLAWWRWWWCSRRWDFLLKTSPSSWPSTGSSTGYRWWGWRQLVTDVQLFCIFVSRSHFSMLFHSCAVKESWKLEKDWICLQVPNNNQCAWRLPWGWNRLPPQQGRTWRFRKTAHQVSLVPSDTIFVRWLAQLEKMHNKTCTRHADGGFESVPMTDAEENGHPGKWDNGVRILVRLFTLNEILRL